MPAVHMPRMRPGAAVLTLCLLAAPLRAATVDSVYAALRLPELLTVMQEEGGQMSQTLAREYLEGDGGTGWAAMVDKIYDADRMNALMRSGFREELSDLPPEALTRLEVFFTEGAGQEIVALEIEGRRAFLDPEVEDTAEARAETLEVDAPERHAAINDYIAANDLVEMNVSGALNANLHFYQGLVDGGAFAMAEEEMLREVWSQEAATREESQVWLMAYLTFAYAPLDLADIHAYADLSKTAAGQAMNRALFAGFETLYNEIYHDLGLAVSFQMTGEDL
ncbi:hypothetical protein [Pseudooceanicola aestuarii]|uniref:hypothetical protein n=1 Tax=Pseudooceanicola aestuarii TaxID=2697319 RepID=UPI0013D098BE|nr:hypothetical protein [Pseudooceanicola aestuarii]